jgi:hypothetical protein
MAYPWAYAMRLAITRAKLNNRRQRVYGINEYSSGKYRWHYGVIDARTK